MIAENDNPTGDMGTTTDEGAGSQEMESSGKIEKVSEKQVAALNAVLQNIQIFGTPKYEDVGFRFGMRPAGIRALLWKYRRGLLDLKGSILSDKREINARDQLQMILGHLSELEQIIIEAMAQKMKALKDAVNDEDADKDAYRKTGIMENIEDLNKISRVRLLREKSLLELIETIQRQRTAEHQEKAVEGKVVEKPEISVPLSDNEKVARAFNQRRKEKIIEA